MKHSSAAPTTLSTCSQRLETHSAIVWLKGPQIDQVEGLLIAVSRNIFQRVTALKTMAASWSPRCSRMVHRSSHNRWGSAQGGPNDQLNHASRVQRMSKISNQVLHSAAITFKGPKRLALTIHTTEKRPKVVRQCHCPQFCCPSIHSSNSFQPYKTRLFWNLWDKRWKSPP